MATSTSRQLAQQCARVQVRAHLATGSTGGMQRDPRRRPLIGEPDPGNIEQELGEFENPLGECSRLAQQSRIVGENLGIVVTHHAGAGTGRDDHRPRFRKETQLRQRHRAGLLGKATAVRRLPAAGLVSREMNLDSLALEQADGIHAGLRTEHVDQAGPEEVDPGRLFRVLAAACFVHRMLLGLTLADKW
jgi:hypothetical protein